jgi:hypothetical protein
MKKHGTITVKWFYPLTYTLFFLTFLFWALRISDPPLPPVQTIPVAPLLDGTTLVLLMVFLMGTGILLVSALFCAGCVIGLAYSMQKYYRALLFALLAGVDLFLLHGIQANSGDVRTTFLLLCTLVSATILYLVLRQYPRRKTTLRFLRSSQSFARTVMIGISCTTFIHWMLLLWSVISAGSFPQEVSWFVTNALVLTIMLCATMGVLFLSRNRHWRFRDGVSHPLVVK